MKSLFSRIEKYFDKSYGGRYFSEIIKEMASEDPSIIWALFSKSGHQLPKNILVETETFFSISSRKRYADITVSSKETNQILGFVEVKFEDHKNEKNGLQIADYMRLCKKLSVPFVYLTQHYPPQKDLQIIRSSGHRHLLFSEFAEEIKTNQSVKHQPFRVLILNYLKERGLMFSEIDPKVLWKFMVRLFNPFGGHGKVRSDADMTENIPLVFASLLGNMKSLSIEFTHRVDGLINKAPSVDFYVEPWISSNVEKQGNFKDKSFNLESKHKAGGIFYTYVQIPIKSGQNWIYLEYGIFTEIAPFQKSVDTGAYSMISCKGLKDKAKYYSEIYFNSKKLSDKNHLINQIENCLFKTFQAALEDLSKEEKLIRKFRDGILNEIKV